MRSRTTARRQKQPRSILCQLFSSISPRITAATVVPGRIAYRLAVVMVMMVPMTVPMIMAMAVIMIVMVQMRLSLRQPRILAEHQRLDGHRHRHRGQSDAAEVDVIEVP